MRIFEDADGECWDVVAGRESWGALVAIFIPHDRHGAEGRGRGNRIRQAPLRSSSYEEAAGELRSLDDDELRSLLERSVRKND